MKTRHLFPLLFIFLNPAWADFTNTKVWHHPLYLTANEPYLIDLRGEWPTDCHPGEQKPVISEYTGDSVLIEFETILEHVTCNEVVTPYRVLVDMSDVIDTAEKEYDFIDITVRYDGFELEEQLTTFCGLWCDPPPPPRDIKPEAGLYHSDGLEKQGLLLARQNQRMGVFPLIYDESGSSEWLLASGGIVEDVFFADLYELTGGQCLGCMPPDEPVEMNKVGKFSMLMDSQGLVQVKVNDGLFSTYEQTDFGYGSRDVGGHPNRRIPDLSGRWAYVEDVPDSPLVVEGDSVKDPLVFDIKLESVTVVEPPTFRPLPPMLPGYVKFSGQSKFGTELWQMQCDYGSDLDNISDAEILCIVNNQEINQGDALFEVKILSAERLSFVWVGPIVSGQVAFTRIAVRVD